LLVADKQLPNFRITPDAQCFFEVLAVVATALLKLYHDRTARTSREEGPHAEISEEANRTEKESPSTPEEAGWRDTD
jgi:hypothetical protein